MANGTGTAIPVPGTTPQTGGLNIPDYQKKVQSAAAATRRTGEPSKQGLASAEKAAGQLRGARGDVGRAAVESFRTQAGAQKSQAQKAASALEMMGESTQRGLQNLEAIQSSVRQTAQRATESWGTAAEKADEYVKAARTRVGEVLGKLDQVNEEFGKERSFAKAHAMQASVQATIGSMRREERNILENYGTDSPEYQQFQASKRSALATVQSNIHASYQQMQEQQNQTYINAVSDAYTKSNMYLGFQEQQHVEMLKFREQSRTAYALQVSQFDVAVEQMKMSGMENLANWMVETPSFTMDMTPLMTLLSDLQTAQETEARAMQVEGAQARLTSAEAGRSEMWNKYLGQRLGVGGGR